MKANLLEFLTDVRPSRVTLFPVMLEWKRENGMH
jgi:hypothetical protein